MAGQLQRVMVVYLHSGSTLSLSLATDVKSSQNAAGKRFLLSAALTDGSQVLVDAMVIGGVLTFDCSDPTLRS